MGTKAGNVLGIPNWRLTSEDGVCRRCGLICSHGDAIEVSGVSEAKDDREANEDSERDKADKEDETGEMACSSAE